MTPSELRNGTGARLVNSSVWAVDTNPNMDLAEVSGNWVRSMGSSSDNENYEDPTPVDQQLEACKVAGAAASKDCSDAIEGIQEELDECGETVAELELENDELAGANEELEDLVGLIGSRGAFYEQGNGLWVDPGGFGSISSVIGMLAVLNPDAWTITFTFTGIVTVSGDPRISGANNGFGLWRQYNAAGTSWKKINVPTNWYVNENFPSFTATADVPYDPTFSLGGGYITSSYQVYGGASTTQTDFEWYFPQ